MKRFPDVMIDIETAGTADDAPIASIGVVLFDRKDPTREREKLKLLLKWDMQRGRAPSGSTMKWWLAQTPDAQKHMLECAEKGTPLEPALRKMLTFIADHCSVMKDLNIWANDCDFDCRILNHAFKQVALGEALKYWTFRSVRTMKMLRKDMKLPEIAFQGTKHDCLADADYQADIVQQVHSAAMGAN